MSALVRSVARRREAEARIHRWIDWRRSCPIDALQVWTREQFKMVLRIRAA
jgi:hypothetical protein